MKRTLTPLFVLCMSLANAQSVFVCSGQSATLTAANPSGLTSPSYSLAPGGAVSSSGQFVVTPSVSTTYTLYTTGSNGSNLVTTSSSTQVGVNLPPTFSVLSSENFTLGCKTKGKVVAHIVNAQTYPSGGAISYSFLSSGSGSLSGGFLGTASSYTITAPGVYTAVARDAFSLCDGKVAFSVLSNVTPPVIDSVHAAVFTCTNTTQVLQGFSSSPNISARWTNPSNSHLSGSTYTALANTSNLTSTVSTYTFAVTDNNNLCESSVTVPVYQNLIPPMAKAVASGSSITCATPSVVLSNQSTSQSPPQLGNSKPVVAALWLGPGPLLPATMTSSYVASVPGTYSLTVTDLNNGCNSTTFITIADNRDYPVVSPPGLFYLCGSTVAIAPNINSGVSGLTFTWSPPAGANVQGLNSTVLVTDATGDYTLHVQNHPEGCVTETVFKVGQCTGITDNILAGVLVYPNPTAGPLVVTLPPGQLKPDLKVYDMVGKLLLSKKMTGPEKIDLTEYGRGVYVVKIEAEGLSRVIRVIRD